MGYDSKYTGQQVEELLEKAGTALQSVPEEYVTATELEGKQDTIADLDTIREGASKGATAVQPSSLAKVATSGSYADLSNKPSIPAEQVNADWNATSGKAQILNKPTIPTVPTKVSEFENDAQYITEEEADGKYQPLGAGGGESVQEVYVMSMMETSAVIYAGLKAAYTSGIRMFFLDTYYAGVIPAIAVPTDDELNSFIVLYNLIMPDGLSSDISSAQMQISALEITESEVKTLAGGQIPIGGGGIHVVNVDGDPATELAGLQAALAEKKQINLYDVSFGGNAPCFIFGALDGSGSEYILLTFVTYVTGDTLSQYQYAINASAITRINIGTRNTNDLQISDYVSYRRFNQSAGDTTEELSPNTFYVWDEVASLTLTLGAEVEGRANEYLFQFTSGATATTLTMPSDLTWANGEALTPEANKTYQVSIVNGYAVYSAF